ncbi:MAG: response regulator [Planctomycetaceae bacterium]|nr:response regulator [Planctomycetaceae bacterium]
MPTILVVDDSEVDRRLVGGLLQKHGGYTLDFAVDGNAALAVFERGAPDLVLTDLQMPEMDGLKLVAAIKADFPLTPVILMTSQGSEEIAAEALRRGAASYVPKRKLADDLLETVERVLAAAREDRTHSRLMHHLTQSESQFDLGNDLTLIRSLVSYLQQQLRCLPLGDETERLRVGIALEEALKNAYYHGSLEVGNGAGWPQKKAIEQIVSERLNAEPYRNRRIHVSAQVSRHEAVFVVRDAGPGFDHSKLPDPADAARLNQTSGRGIVLMRTIMDEVRYNAAGNEVTLVKRAPVTDEDPIEDAER